MFDIFKTLAARWHTEADECEAASGMADGLDKVMVQAKAGWMRLLAQELEIEIRRAELNHGILSQEILTQIAARN